MRLSSVVNQTDTIGIPFGDEKLTVTFRPSAYTPALEDAVRDAGKEDGKDSLTQLMATLLVGWTLTDDDGAPIGVDVESLRGLPIKFLSAVVTPIVETFSPKGKKADS